MAVKVSVSPIGAICGGISGAILRPALIVPQLWPQLNGDQRHFVLMLSVSIGFAVGALAGLVGKPLIGAVVGACLALMAYGLTILPMAACFCLLLLEQGQGGEPPHWSLVALTGALAGAVGGLAETLSQRRAGLSQTGHSVGSTPTTDEPADEGGGPPQSSSGGTAP
jgi:hypothetical protein